MKIATRTLLVLFCFSVISVSEPYANSDAKGFTSGAEKFVESLANSAISSLTNQTLTQKERQNNFRGLLRDYFDINGIGKWALGRYWRKASQKERTEYLELFENLIVGTYSNRFNAYSDEKLLVKGSTSRGRFALVRSLLNRDDQKPIRIDWRVTQPDGNYKIFDIIVEGVSMIQTQRSEFSSVIRRNGGNVSGLLAALRKKVNKAN